MTTLRLETEDGQVVELTAEEYKAGLQALTSSTSAERERLLKLLAAMTELLQSLPEAPETRPAGFAPPAPPARRPKIVKTPDVCGGSARVDGTRIPVWQLVEERDQGATEAQLLSNYQTLTARDLVAAWDYVDEHPEEIAGEIRRNSEGVLLSEGV
jgi:uncharacterized protein (DUF433 family)